MVDINNIWLKYDCMFLKLKDIATISSGETFRSRIETSASGDVRVIQMKDLDANDTVNLEKVIQIRYSKPKPNQLVKQSDIIFRSRGKTNTAALLQKDTRNTIVASPLFRIRPDTEKVLPEFLFWWINQPSSQAYFSSRSEGSMLKMISKKVLANLEVSLPSLEQQRKIADFFNLSMEEQRLLEKIKKNKAIFVQAILMQIASQSRLTASNKKT